MRKLGMPRLPIVSGLCLALFLAPTLAVPQEQTKQGQNAIDARQGFMRIVVWEAGPLFAMAKGDIAYDADEAMNRARQLNAIIDYDIARVFIPDTSKPVYTGETRALPTIWEEPDRFEQQFEDMRDKAAVVLAEAGKGKDALTAAVSELGKSCGSCHDDYRADEF